jgi:hypothetical protein
MVYENVICIALNPQFNIINVTNNGTRFLEYKDLRELEFKGIDILIPMPSAALHAKIFAEMQRTYTDKEKYFEIAKLGASAMNNNTSMHLQTKSPVEILERLHEPSAAKWVIANGGKQKRAGICIDMKVDRYCDVYLLPIYAAFPSPSSLPTPALSRSNSGSYSGTDSGSYSGTDSGSDSGEYSSIGTMLNPLEQCKGPPRPQKEKDQGRLGLRHAHVHVHAASTPKLVSVLRAIKCLRTHREES